MTDKEIKLTGVQALVALVLIVLLVFAKDLFLGWILMLVLGAIHSHSEGVPAYSYWTCFLIAVGVSIVASVFSPRRA